MAEMAGGLEEGRPHLVSSGSAEEGRFRIQKPGGGRGDTSV